MGYAQDMRLAIAEAKKAAAEGETPVGAVILRQDEVIAAAHNMTEQTGDPTAHAELLAIRRAAEALGDWRLTDCRMAVTMEPCPMCAGAILLSRLDGVIFGAYDGEMGCCGSRLDLPDGLLPRRARCVGGVLEEECAALLREFYATKRNRAL